MRLSNIKRLLKEDLPNEVQKWIDKLLVPINLAISQFTEALTNQLTVTDNMLGAVKVFSLKGNQFPFVFNHGLNVRPKIMFIAQIQDSSSAPATFTVAPYAQWSLGQSGATIEIQTITGLDPTRTYSVTLVILAA